MQNNKGQRSRTDCARDLRCARKGLPALSRYKVEWSRTPGQWLPCRLLRQPTSCTLPCFAPHHYPFTPSALLPPDREALGSEGAGQLIPPHPLPQRSSLSRRAGPAPCSRPRCPVQEVTGLPGSGLAWPGRPPS
ncbi:hypothetical protein KIL84_022952 [Mauremys mutica]|uniref:Uncharacterized protein n=1 Tax=Mauremys mutica TaxID=74926 RepID=A0A9D3WRR6_9SAUR|nr:hypothetical protein KIL84_022952 [Mauremys mutica]